MVSVGLGRASRGLTAIPVQAAGGPEPRAQRSGPAQRRAVEGGFLGPRGAPAAASARKLGTGFRSSRCGLKAGAGKKPDRPAEGPAAAW